MEQLSAMDKMWVSFIAIGLMVVASLIVTFAKTKTKGILRTILTIIAFIVLLIALLYGFISIV